MISFLTSKLGIALLAVVALLVVVGVIYFQSRNAGGSAVRVEQLERTNETQRKIDDADARGPRTPGDVDQRLRDGRF
jgi:hypothetical protein